jgi:two-component system, cell cycle sensor histidine kinase and response regulator CckA
MTTTMTDDLSAIVRARRRRLRQELGVRATIAVMVLVFNESYHGAGLICVAALTALALNAPYYLATLTGWRIRLQAYVRLIVDILLITLGLYGAGGLQAAPYLSVYMVAPIYVAFVLSGGACLFAAGLATASFLVAALLQHTYSPSSTAIQQGPWPIAIFNLVLLNVVAGLTALLAAAYRQSRRQLAESEECFRSVAEAATDAILVTDDSGSVVVSNRAAEAMFGYPNSEMLHAPIGRLVLIPDQYREAGGHSPEGLLTKGIKPIELTGVKIDGAQFPVELSAERWATRRGTFFTCIVRDVTSRRKIEALAHESSEVLRAVVQSSPIAVWAHRFDGGLTIWNPAAERMFGWMADEVLGKYPPFVPDDRLSESHSIFERALAGAELLNVEVRRRRKDGTEIDISLSTAPLRNAEGAVTGTVTLGLDISERKELERQNRQLQKMDTLGSLAGGIAHDFNNLVSIITGRVHLIGRELEADHPTRRHLELINHTAGRAGALTQQLLAFSRKQVFCWSVLKLTSVMQGIEPILRRLIGEDVELLISQSGEVGCIEGDRAQLEQVIMNLVVNAREAMPSGGRIGLEISEGMPDRVPGGQPPRTAASPCVVLTVTDTGVGMDEATRSQIFEPFFTTKAAGRGTGLGLSTVYGIVKQHGGLISVDSSPGRGTTFKVYLPRTAEAPPAPEQDRPAVVMPRGTEKVLLVEDDAEVRSLAREVLEKSGYSVVEAALPTTALQIAARTRVDLVLTDVVLPQMRGRALVERVARLQPHITALFMSGYPDDPNIRDWTPDLDLLRKPLTPETLLVRVRGALDRTRRRRRRPSRPGAGRTGSERP